MTLLLANLHYHGKIRDFACRLPLRASTLNLFNRVVHFDESRGFNEYIESVYTRRIGRSLHDIFV